MVTSGEGISTAPHWSPDGDYLAFAWNQSSKDINIWTVPAVGGEPEPVTLTTKPATMPRWSPDGEYIAYTLGSQIGISLEDIWTVPSSGGRPVRLTTHPARDLFPLWLAGGKDLAFLSNRNQEATWLYDLWTVPVEDGKARMFFSRASGTLNRPSISPDGKQIAYSTGNNVGDTLYVASLASGKERLIGRGTLPSFSPDGRRVAYYLGGDTRPSIWVADVSRIVRFNPNPEL